MVELDRDKPYGILYGFDKIPGATFEQGGRYFNGRGEYVGCEAGNEPEVKPEEPVELAGHLQDPSPDLVPESGELKSVFTPEERRILELASQGKKQGEIGRELGIKHQTVGGFLRKHASPNP